MKAVGFDLGETLIHYKNISNGSFQEHFKAALMKVINDLSLQHIDDDLIIEGEVILTKYNTRIFPRDHEIQDIHIFSEIFEVWGVDKSQLDDAIGSFFSFFQRGSELYEDTLEVLTRLKEKQVRIGILTDVPYGLNKQLVLRDIAPFHCLVDTLVTSVDVGWRKPRIEGYTLLAKQLGTTPDQMMYVGNEWKDITGANRSGARSVLINREGAERNWGQHLTLKSLHELLSHLS
ncbi:MAG: hypothetical protein K0R67_3005 [Paenibacillus sp.]|nr:hypothetical protein [Paenibacillus sp.]